MSKLKAAYQEEMKKVKSIIEGMPWSDPEFYCEWMAQTYFYASYSTRIIGLSGCLFPLERTHLHNRFLDHAREEKNHERILISDLKEYGRRIEDYQCFSSTAAIYRTQYYWIQNVNPISVYGYFLFLEGIAVEHGKAMLEGALRGNPEKSLKFLKVHVEEDVDHVDKHFEMLEKASPEEIGMIRENMIQTSDYYVGMLRDVAEKAGRVGRRKSA